MTISDNAIKNDESRTSDIFWMASAVAIYLVICAHCTYSNSLLQKITSLIGSVGVPIFLVRSGYYFSTKESFSVFWTKKIKHLVIPWALISPCLYLLSIRKVIFAFDLLNCFLFCIGYNTWLYFVTILFVYYIVFRGIKHDGFLYFAIVIFFVSNIMDVFGINWLTNITTPYLNFCNRIGYFAAGAILKRKQLLSGILNNKRLFILNCIIVPLFGYLIVCSGNGGGTALYTVGLIFYRLIFLCFVFQIIGKLSGLDMLIRIGKDTYLIYFLHMQLGIGMASVIIRTLHIHNETVIFLIKPLLVLLLVLAGIWLLKAILQKTKLEKMYWVIGLK